MRLITLFINWGEDKLLTMAVFVVMIFIAIAKALKVVGEDKIKSRALQVSSFMFSFIAGGFGWFLAKYYSDNPYLLGMVVFASTWKGESMLKAFSDAIEEKFEDVLNINKDETRNEKEE